MRPNLRSETRSSGPASVAAPAPVVPGPAPAGVEEGDGAAGGSASGAGNPVDLSQTFLLHSLPGAKHTIYLDFD